MQHNIHLFIKTQKEKEFLSPSNVHFSDEKRLCCQAPGAGRRRVKSTLSSTTLLQRFIEAAVLKAAVEIKLTAGGGGGGSGPFDNWSFTPQVVKGKQIVFCSAAATLHRR